LGCGVVRLLAITTDWGKNAWRKLT
jgi:hypothetical protein